MTPSDVCEWENFVQDKLSTDDNYNTLNIIIITATISFIFKKCETEIKSPYFLFDMKSFFQ